MEGEGLYYRGALSPPAVEFASPQGKQLFIEALEGGNMEGFFKLISYYQTQSEINYCGIGSLAVVLNALAIDPGRTWKGTGTGPWRWFDDTMLDCCESISKIKAEGISFDKVAFMAYCNGADVDAFRTDETSIDDFRRHVIFSASSEDSHLITSYHRAVFKQNGNGHYSPIGGYHAGRDMVLILDVARFKYPPHWMPLLLLWEATNTIDEATGQHRGFMIISRSRKVSSVLYSLSNGHEGWNKITKYLTEDVPLRLKLNDVKDIENLLSVVFKSTPVDLKQFDKCIAEIWKQEDACVVSSQIEKEEVLKQIEETELFKHVNRWLASEISLCKGVMSLDLKEIPENFSCQGSQLWGGKLRQLGKTCCKETREALCSSINSLHYLCDFDHPSTACILTLLLLAMPQRTWSGIKQEKLLALIHCLTSIDNLPALLQRQVLQLRRQLHFLMIHLRGPLLSG